MKGKDLKLGVDASVQRARSERSAEAGVNANLGTGILAIPIQRFVCGDCAGGAVLDIDNDTNKSVRRICIAEDI